MKKIQGQRDPQLSGYGRKEARLLAKRFKGLSFDAVYTSPLRRSYQTAEIVVGKKTPIIREDGLKEICLGDWEGRTLRSIRKEYGEMFDRWAVRPSRIRIPGGEDFKSFVKRVKKTIRRIESAGEGCNVLVVCHGGVISTYATVVLNLPPDDVWCLTVKNASLTIVEVGLDLPKLITFNDISHLISLKEFKPTDVTHVD
jgi:probable phosphoglycerate mutase